MSTRGRIGIRLGNNRIRSAYHHFDSYPEWLGRVLRTHYNSKESATKLIAGGDMSCCWTKDRWDDSADGTYAPQYYSQRGEKCPPRIDVSLAEYLGNGEEYAYIFDKDEWVCYDLHDEPEVIAIPPAPLHE